MDITGTSNGQDEVIRSSGLIVPASDPDVYPTRTVAVGNLFDRKGKLILLLRDKNDPGTGARVESAGGGVLKYEPIRRGLLREICEELNHRKHPAGLSPARIVSTHSLGDEVKVLDSGEVLRLHHYACKIDCLFSEIVVDLSPDHERFAVVLPNRKMIHVPYTGGPIIFSNLPLERQEHVLKGRKAIFRRYLR